MGKLWAFDQCGAGTGPGGGFGKGNTCAKSKGDSRRDELETAMIVESGNDDRSKKGSVTKRAGVIYGKIEKHPWQTSDELTAKRRDGKRDVSFTATQIKTMKRLGFTQTAWDANGMPHYAAVGETVPDWLTQSDDPDFDWASLPARPRGDSMLPSVPTPKKTRPKKARPKSKSIKWTTGESSTRIGFTVDVDSDGRVIGGTVRDTTNTRTRRADDVAPPAGADFKEWLKRVGGKSHTVRGSMKFSGLSLADSCGAGTGDGGGFGKGNTCAKGGGKSEAVRVLDYVVDDLAFYGSGLSGNGIEGGFHRYARDKKMSAAETDKLIADAKDYATKNNTYALDRYESSKAKFAGKTADRKKIESANWSEVTRKPLKLTDAQSAALDDYAAAGSGEMGEISRTGGMSESIGLIDAAINANSFDRDIEVYHGTEWKHVDVADMKSLVGKTIHDNAFLSTTTNFETANRFANGSTTDAGEWISGTIKLTIPKGTPAIHMGTRNKFFTESEVLLGRNVGLKVTGIEDLSAHENGKLGVIVHAEIVNADLSLADSCGAGTGSGGGFGPGNTCAKSKGGPALKEIFSRGINAPGIVFPIDGYLDTPANYDSAFSESGTMKNANWTFDNIAELEPVRNNSRDPLLFRKQVIFAGNHCKGESDEFDVTEDMIDHWVETCTQMLSDGVEIPWPTKHKEDDPELNRAYTTSVAKALDSKGRPSLYALGRFTDPDAAKLRDRSNVSLYCPAKRATGGKTYHRPITHFAFTNYPVIKGLEGFTELRLSYDAADECDGDDGDSTECPVCAKRKRDAAARLEAFKEKDHSRIDNAARELAEIHGKSFVCKQPNTTDVLVCAEPPADCEAVLVFFRK